MRFLGGRRAPFLAVPVVVASLWSVLSVPVLPVHAATRWQAAPRSVVSVPRRVTRSTVPTASGRHTTVPLRVRDQAAYSAAKQQPAASSAGSIRALAPTTSATVRRPQQAQPLTTGFALMSRDKERAAFPSQSIEPPDTQVAAGTVNLLEMVNETGSVWDKSTGTEVGTPFDLNVFPFAVPTGYSVTDPRVLYDASTGTWIATIASLNMTATPNGFQAYIATTKATDPGGMTTTWVVHTIYDSATNSATPGTPDLCDQPKLGMSDDKLVVACDLYNGNTFDGAYIMVMSRTLIESGAPIPPNGISRFGPILSAFSVAPAVSLSSTTTAFMAYNLGEQPNQVLTHTLGVLAAIGDPTINQALPGGVQVFETDAPINPTTIPPNAQQAGTTCNPAIAEPNGCIATNDDRLVSATWKDGMLWLTANDGCVPQGDTVTRSCARLFRINTTQWPGVTVELDGDLYSTGAYIYFPALTVDAFGNAMISYSQSSSTMFVSAVAVDYLTSFGALGSPVPITAGAATYPSPGKRWGDYSSAVLDPQNPSDVWVAAEYVATPVDPTKPGNWATGAMLLAVQPLISDLTPTTGPPAGGQAVTIHGSFFQTGAAVMFGSTAAPSVTVVDSGTLQATTPPNTGGTTVPVSVKNADGSASGTSFAYVYLSGIYALDGYGGIHPDGGSASLSGGPYWPNWKIARSSVLLPNATGGYVLDGYGGIHPFGSAPAPIQSDVSYFGFDIARDIALMPGASSSGASGYVLDGWGGLHPFHAGTAPQSAPATATPYWKNWDIAKRVVVFNSGDGGYVMDGWGGLHPFGIGTNPAPAVDPNHAYWPNWSIARDVVLLPGSTATNAPGLILDGYGGLHPFNFGSTTPSITGAAYFAGNDFAESVRVSPAATSGNIQGWVMDAWGGLHAFGGAGTISPSSYWPNWRIAAQLMVQ